MSGMFILWIIVLIATILIEAATMGLTTIWFSGGALAAMLVEMLGGSIYLQIIVFLVASLILLYFTRPVEIKYFNKEREKTNLDSLLGKQAVVTSSIHNLSETGQIMLDGKEWTARSTDPSITFEEGDTVRVVSIKGVKLMVEAIEKS